MYSIKLIVTLNLARTLNSRGNQFVNISKNLSSRKYFRIYSMVVVVEFFSVTSHLQLGRYTTYSQKPGAALD